MENASKALMIAGAVLITILVLGIAIYFYTQVKEFPKAQEEALERAQIAKFNQEYESYNKQKMYGVDVVTVLNKAISNNKKYADPINGKYLRANNHYYIDVEIKINKSVESFAVQYKEEPDGIQDKDGNYKKYVDEIRYDSKNKNKNKITGYVNGDINKELEHKFTTVFEANKSINLLTQSGNQQLMNKTIEKFLESFDTVKIQVKGEKYDKFNYALVYSGFIDFKRKHFQCTGIEYDRETSRVSKIIFKEI